MRTIVLFVAIALFIPRIQAAACTTEAEPTWDFNKKRYETIHGFNIPEFKIHNTSSFKTIAVWFHSGKWIVSWLDPRNSGEDKVVDMQEFTGPEKVRDLVKKYCPEEANLIDQITSQTAARFAFALPPTGQTVQTVTLDDWNGDGTEDIAYVDGTNLIVKVLNAQGVGTSTKTFTTGPDPAYILSGDFNSDGRIDIVVGSKVANPAAGSTMLFLNNGGGDFAAGTTLATNGGAIATGDFNKDGKPDLIIGNATGFRRLQGTGLGTFPNNDGFALGFQPFSIVAADFNGDGNLDVVAHDRFSSQVALRFGQGNGSFAAAVVSPGGPSTDFRGALAYSDFNHDGQLDLLIRYPLSHMLSLLPGTSNGSFQTARNYVSPGENPSMSLLPLPDGTTGVFLGDDFGTEFFLYTAYEDATLGAPVLNRLATTIAGFAAADFTGDGKADLVAGLTSNQAVLLRNPGDGTFPTANTVGLSGRPTGAIAVDLNADNRKEAVIPMRDGNVAVIPGSANGTFGTATPYAAGTSPSNPRIADFNKDGRPDLAVIPELFSGGQGRVAVLAGNGQGGFGTAAFLNTGAGDLTGIATGDFTGDQNPDIAVTTVTGGGFGAGNIALFRGRGDGTFFDPILSPIASSYAAAAGDFDLDGKLDLAIVQNGDKINIFLGNNNGTWRAGPSIQAETTGTDLQALDLNGDGFLDLVNNSCCGRVRTTYILGYSNGFFNPERPLAAPADPGALVIADLNGDGTVDLALGGIDGYYAVHLLHFPSMVVINAAAVKYRIAPDSIASAYGSRLATPASPTGSTVTVKDSAGVTRSAYIFYSSPTLVNFTVPVGTALGAATVTVTASDGSTNSTKVTVENTVPSLFVLNGANLVAANVIRANANGNTAEDIFQFNNGALVAKPINMGPATDSIFLVLYGTGLRNAGVAGTTVNIAGTSIPVEYAGLQGSYPGFDQVNIKLPRSLIGKGPVELVMTVNGEAANTVTLTIQ